MWRLSVLIAGAAASQTGDDASVLLQTGAAQQKVEVFRDHLVEGYSFRKFVDKFGRTYAPGSDEWAKREQIFESNRKDLLATRAKGFHETGAGSWTAGVTKFMDYDMAEYKRLLGRKGPSRHSSHPATTALYAKPTHAHVAPPKTGAALGDPHGPMTKSLTVTEYFTISPGSDPIGHLVRDQGGCGSCWAEAATAALESAMEKNISIVENLNETMKSLGKGKWLPTLSSQAMVSCTPNPRHCGGSGGCEGAVSEQGFELARDHGLPLAAHLPYKSGNGNSGNCPDKIFQKSKLFVTAYTVLPSNKFEPLKRALVEHGAAIVISVDATNWQYYYDGIYTDTAVDPKGEFQVNHAVTLMGWKSGPKGYWLVKNSWGGEWGEKGFIRIEMKENEDEHCGMDTNTHQGLACDGDPDTALVCGTCGILYDSSFPTGLYFK